MTITRLDKPVIRSIREAMADVLQEVAQRFDVSIDAGSARFSPAEATVKFKVTLNNLAEGIDTKEVANYKFHASLENLPPLGSVIRIGGDEFELTGWNTRARRYPIKAVQVRTNKKYKLAPVSVKLAEVVS